MSETPTTTTTFEDKTLKCCDCGEPFTWTVGEQEWFAKQKDPDSGKPFVPPRRCKKCRDQRKAQRPAK